MCRVITATNPQQPCSFSVNDLDGSRRLGTGPFGGYALPKAPDQGSPVFVKTMASRFLDLEATCNILDSEPEMDTLPEDEKSPGATPTDTEEEKEMPPAKRRRRGGRPPSDRDWETQEVFNTGIEGFKVLL